ncbi:Arm DNA-binding domain-containing protein [Methylophilus sp. Leaf414]|uniref:Arm DNA-binding domain-containing protein n=1 Tax=Methylophilus sp. Leaf414 TaxID=1736371 RepID=UPI0035166D8B
MCLTNLYSRKLYIWHSLIHSSATLNQLRDYSITDGQGLSILMTSKGAKGWRFRYRHQGKPKLMSFGTYPEVTLQQARAKT